MLLKEKWEALYDFSQDREEYERLCAEMCYNTENNIECAKKLNKLSKKLEFKDTIDNYIVQDKIVRINSDELENANRIKVQSEVSTNKNGFELRHSINAISSKIGMRYDRTRLMLERMFWKQKLFTKKLVDLTLTEFYAFVINKRYS